MSNDLRRLQEIGWRRNDTGTFGADPIIDTDETFFEFGEYAQPFGEFPILKTKLIKAYSGGTLDPKSINVASTEVAGQLTGVMLDGLPFYKMNCRKESSPGVEDGGVVDDGSNEYTITPITGGEVDDYVVRWHRQNSSVATRKSVVGSRFWSFNMSLNLSQKRIPLGFTMAFMGTLMQPIQSGTIDYTLQQPDTLDTPFYFDDSANSIFEWDTGDAQVDLSDELLGFSYTEDTLNRLGRISGQHYPKYNITGDRIHVLAFTLEDRDNSSIFDDYMDQAGTGLIPNDDFKGLKFKIPNANGKFIQCTYNDIGITEIKQPHTLINGEKVPTYEVLAECKTIAPVIKDGITTLDHYGISA